MATAQRTEDRVLAGRAQVFYRPERATQGARRYLMGLADDVSLGGLFIAAQQPPPAGTVLQLHLYSTADHEHTSPLCARAVVRWRRMWGKQRGMGVRFIEFQGHSERQVEDWLATLADSDGRVPMRPPGPAAA